MPQAITDYGSYTVPVGESQFLKTTVGDNKIRLCSMPIEIVTHPVKDGGKTSFFDCAGEGCEHCKKNVKKQYRYAYLCISRKDGKPYVFEAPLTVFKQILQYATDKEYGNPMDYDLNVKKEGDGLQTVYTVIGYPKKPLTIEETKMLEEANIDIKEKYLEKRAKK